MNFEVATLHDMKNLGMMIASDVGPGQMWHLHGELGSGKTTLIQFIFAALGIEEPVLSPTYAIYEPYESPHGLKLLHMDLYRIERPETLMHIGLDFYEDGEYSWFVEWPSRGQDMIPAADRKISIARSGPGRQGLVTVQGAEDGASK